MNLKSKLFGFAAATALSLSMMSGAMAANTDSVNGSVILQPTYCGVTIDQASVNFGTWKWNGDLEEYQHVGGSNVQTITGKLTSGQPNGTCDIKLDFDGLTNGTNTIDATSFGVTVPGVGTMDPIESIWANWLSGDGNVPNVPAGSGSVEMKLNSVPDTYAPDTYSGTLKVEITKTN